MLPSEGLLHKASLILHWEHREMSLTEDGEQKPFLPGKEEPDYDDIPQSERGFAQSRTFKTHGFLFVLQIVLFALNVSLLIWNFHFTGDRKNDDAHGDVVEQVYSKLAPDPAFYRVSPLYLLNSTVLV